MTNIEISFNSLAQKIFQNSNPYKNQFRIKSTNRILELDVQPICARSCLLTQRVANKTGFFFLVMLMVLEMWINCRYLTKAARRHRTVIYVGQREPPHLLYHV